MYDKSFLRNKRQVLLEWWTRRYSFIFCNNRFCLYTIQKTANDNDSSICENIHLLAITIAKFEGYLLWIESFHFLAIAIVDHTKRSASFETHLQIFMRFTVIELGFLLLTFQCRNKYTFNDNASNPLICWFAGKMVTIRQEEICWCSG